MESERPASFRRRSNPRQAKGWGRLLRPLMIGLIILLPVGLGAMIFSLRPPDCPGHWHSTFQVYMDGHRIPFARKVFLESPSGIPNFDLHGDDQIMHYHPPISHYRCIPLSTFMHQLGIALDDDSITFNEYFGANAGTYHNNATHELRVYYSEYNGTWNRVLWSDVSDQQMLPGAKVLISFGQWSDVELERQLASVRDLPAQYFPPGYGPRKNEDVAPPMNETLYPGAEEQNPP